MWIVANDHPPLPSIVGNASRLDNFSKKEIAVQMQVSALLRLALTISWFKFLPRGKKHAISPKRRETCASSTLSSIISGKIAREIRSMMPYFRARMIAGANAR